MDKRLHTIRATNSDPQCHPCAANWSNGTDEETIDLSKIRQDPERSCPSRREQPMHARPPPWNFAAVWEITLSHSVRCSENLYALEKKKNRRRHVLGAMARIGPWKKRSFCYSAKSSWFQQRVIGRATICQLNYVSTVLGNWSAAVVREKRRIKIEEYFGLINRCCCCRRPASC
jgi:hypothetical protein